MICTIRDVDCCAHKKSFNTAIPVRSLGPYMRVHYCTYIDTYSSIDLSLSFNFTILDYLSFVWIVFLKHPIKDFAFHILYFYNSRSLFNSCPSLSFSLYHICLSLFLSYPCLSLSPSPIFLSISLEPRSFSHSWSPPLSLSHPAFLSIFFSRYLSPTIVSLSSFSLPSLSLFLSICGSLSAALYFSFSPAPVSLFIFFLSLSTTPVSRPIFLSPTPVSLLFSHSCLSPSSLSLSHTCILSLPLLSLCPTPDQLTN